MKAPMRMSFLSARAATSDNQIKHAGKIRPGIKVLTKNAQQNPKAIQLYQARVEKQIKGATGMAEIGSMIAGQYGGIRADEKVRQLYRFTVVFHTEDPDEIYPSQFKRQGILAHETAGYAV